MDSNIRHMFIHINVLFTNPKYIVNTIMHIKYIGKKSAINEICQKIFGSINCEINDAIKDNPNIMFREINIYDNRDLISYFL